MKIAVQYRQTFFKDIVVDIIGYRRYGHNNQDQPLFTQPMMYQEIVNRPNIYTLYKNKLLK
jgi:2-oxoglutarate dehydrogenase E1 component